MVGREMGPITSGLGSSCSKVVSLASEELGLTANAFVEQNFRSVGGGGRFHPKQRMIERAGHLTFATGGLTPDVPQQPSSPTAQHQQQHPTAQQPNSPTAQQPNSPTAQQPNSPTAQQPNLRWLLARS